MWICFTESVSEPPPVYIGDEQVERVDKFKLLGMGLQNNLKWNNHVETVKQKANRQVYAGRLIYLIYLIMHLYIMHLYNAGRLIYLQGSRYCNV